ncbi:MAG: carbohydrate ABC transporter permease [Acidimicrobiales bacterium]
MPSPRGGRRRYRKEGRRPIPYLFAGPFYALFALFSIGPIVYAAYLSFFSSTLTGKTLFAGGRNYLDLFSQGSFWSSIIGVVVLGVIQVPVMLFIAVFLAVVIDLGVVRFGSAFRLIYFVPFAIPGVVAAIMWGYVLVPNLSPFDTILGALGLGQPNFLGTNFIWPVLGNILTWEALGYNMLILYTALQAVPPELTEAAVIDGAGLWKIIRYVRLPMIRGALVLTGLFSVIATFQLFTEPDLLRNLTTSISSHFTPNMYLYTQAFAGQQVNLAAAGSLVLAVIIVAATAVVFLVSRRRRGAGT